MGAVISRLGVLYGGALAGKGLGEEAVINIRSGSKETSAKAAKDQCHFAKDRGIDTRDVVGLKDERTARCKKEKKAKYCDREKMKEAAASASTAPVSSKSMQKTEEEDVHVVDMDGGGSEIEESERASVDTDILDLNEALARR